MWTWSLPLQSKHETKSIHGSCHPFSDPRANSPGEPLPVLRASRAELSSIPRTSIPSPEITQVTIRSQLGSSKIPQAELGFCPRTHSLKEVVDRVTVLLNPGKLSSNGSHHPKRESSNGSSGSNGHAQSNGHAIHNSAGSGSAMEHPGVTFTSVTPVRDAKGEIRYFRHGTIVTQWEIKHELPGRLRLRNPVIHRKAELCQAIERELMSVLGIDYFKTNPLTSTVLVQYDRRQLTRDQIIEILEARAGECRAPRP